MLRGELIFSINTINAEIAWLKLAESFPDILDELTEIDFLGAKVKGVSNACNLITRKKMNYFFVRFDGFECNFSSLANSDFTQLLMRRIPYNSFSEIKNKIELLLINKYLVSARIFDRDYNHWQNARDPLQYEVEGRDYSHLPMRHNNLPPPLDRMEIDTSRNPGRRVIRMGYVEAVSSHMWLGPLFWERTGADKEKVLSADWLNPKQINGTVEINVQEECFTDSEGAEGELQHRMLELLFPNTPSSEAS